MAKYFWNEHYNATEVNPFPTTWKYVAVSNPTPAAGEDITITGELWRYLGGPEDPITTGVALVIDELEVTRTTLGANGGFSLKTRAPYVPGPYTYWPTVVYDLRYNGVVFPENHGPPVGIDVSAPPVEFVCPWCGAIFYTQEELEAHMAVCPEQPTPPIPPELLEKILILSSLGLMGVGLVWMAVRR